MCTSLPLQMQVARQEGVEEGDILRSSSFTFLGWINSPNREPKHRAQGYLKNLWMLVLHLNFLYNGTEGLLPQSHTMF